MKGVNIGRGERILSLLGGGGLVAGSAVRRSPLSIPVALAGGYLVYRGVTGHCLFYEALRIRRGPESGGIKVSESITINQPIDKVFGYWRELENLPEFMHHLEAVQRTGDGKSHWRARAIAGRSVEWEAETFALRENEMIAWRSLPGSQVPNTGNVIFRVVPGRGTEIHVALEYSPPGGSAGAAIAKLFGREPSQQVREDLRRLKAIMETGEVPTTEGQPRGPSRRRLMERWVRSLRGGPAQLPSPPDLVQQTSEQSFPSSDAPGWTSGLRRSP